MRAARHEKEAGLTLLELLVGLAVLAAMLAAVPGLLQLGRLSTSTSAEFEAREGEQAGRSFLVQSLSEALPLFEARAGGVAGLAFQGSETSLDYVAPAAAGPTGGGVYRYRLSVRGGTDLVLMAKPFRVGGDFSVSDEARVLMRSRGGLRLRYFGQAVRGGSEPAQWLAAWPRADVLPALIEIELGSEPGGRWRAPVVVAPRLGAGS